jgi:hypothetical protein
MAIERFKNRNKPVDIPKQKQISVAGFTHEYINYMLGGTFRASYTPLNDNIINGKIRGVAGVVGCTNPRVKQDWVHVELVKELIKNDVLVVQTGCSQVSLANAGFEAVHHIGMPEARIILSQVATYLASVPKSNAAYLAIDEALDEVRKQRSHNVPLHLRNAPTKLMKEIGYGEDYKYPHQYPGHFIAQQYLPDSVKGKKYYRPTEMGREAKLKSYLEKNWKNEKRKTQ